MAKIFLMIWIMGADGGVVQLIYGYESVNECVAAAHRAAPYVYSAECIESDAFLVPRQSA